MPLGPFREEDVAKILVSRVILPQRGGKQLRCKVGRKEILVELSVGDVQELGEIRAGESVVLILHSLVENAQKGKANKYEVETGWANGLILGSVDQLVGGRWNGRILDLGNGLRSYLDLEIGSDFEFEKLGSDEWWRIEFALPHQCMMIRKVQNGDKEVE